MGLVDANNKVNFYDGKVRVVGPDGKEHAKYEPKDYLEYVAEHVEPYSYLKYPYLKKVGWKGFVDGAESGVYKATPALPAECVRRHGDAAGAGRVRAVLRDADRRPSRQDAGARHAGDALGARGRTGVSPAKPSLLQAKDDEITSRQDPQHPDRASSARAWASSRRRAAR